MGGIGKKAVGGADAAAAVDGGALLRQLTPGAVKFAKSYALYYEALGDVEKAARLNAAAEQLGNGGALSKESQVQLDEARKDIAKLAKSAKAFDEAATGKWKEANKLYATGLAEWTVVSGTVAAAIKSDPKAVATNPELGLAAGLCVKGLKDLAGFIEIARARANEKDEQGKAAR